MIRLGHKFECPLLFLKHPLPYSIVSITTFWSSLATGIILSEYEWYIPIILLLAIWLFANNRGRIKAFAKYRNILRTLAESANSETEKQSYIEELNKSNAELINDIRAYEQLSL